MKSAGAIIVVAVAVLSAAACDAPSPGGAALAGNDTAPNVSDARSCDTNPGPGCACSEEGARVVCQDVHSEVAGHTVCGLGDSVCTDGKYAPCIINNTITSDWQSKGLGAPTNCANNPCNPQCHTYPDEPDDTLTDVANGVVGTAAGVTLPGAPGLAEAACTGGTSGTCSHSICEVGAALTAGCDATLPGEPSCVSAICTVDPSCCSGAWDTDCTDLLATTCDVSCYADAAGECFSCYSDDFDHDGDGYTGNDGDCLDCDALVNAGAFDFPDNGLDEDCDGTPDNETIVCDGSIPMATSSPYHFAEAIDLCRRTNGNAKGKNKTWGVIRAELARATGNGKPHPRQHSIQSSFGPANVPQGGSRLAALSSGTARTPGQPGDRNPSGQISSYNAGTQCNYPPGFPKNAAGCPSTGSKAYDSASLKLKLRVPTNAKSFSYKFNFFSSEYPEWVCTAYNDHFVALLTGSSALPANPPQNSDNISFDANGDPASVNIAFFDEPGCPTCTSNILSGTGFGGQCWNETCGGATGWLYTTAPVTPGEEIDLQFAVWDQGDHVWDSTVLIDAFKWSVEESEIKTDVEPPQPPPPTYGEGVFVRDYDASGICGAGQTVRWGHWSWQAMTPSDSQIAFHVVTGNSLAELDAKTENALRFSSSPAALAGDHAVARQGSPDTRTGSLVVDDTLAALGEPRWAPFVRIVSRLSPSSDMLFAPTLTDWNLQLTCVDDV